MTTSRDPQSEHHQVMERKRRLSEHVDSHAASGAMADINITPLIDVMLVLLIIFMVVTPLTQKGLDISLPQPPPLPAASASWNANFLSKRNMV